MHPAALDKELCFLDSEPLGAYVNEGLSQRSVGSSLSCPGALPRIWEAVFSVQLPHVLGSQRLLTTRKPLPRNLALLAPKGDTFGSTHSQGGTLGGTGKAPRNFLSKEDPT